MVIQAVIILAHWHQSDDDDIAGSWHWLGLAISLCQTLGLHRDPDALNQDTYAVTERRLWRRLWWSCVARDTWLSLGFGRPMRIKPSRTEVIMPTPEDILTEVKSLSLEVQQEFIPPEMEVLCRYFVHYLTLSHTLGCVLYRTSESILPLQLEELKVWEDEFSRLDHESTGIEGGNFHGLSKIVKIAVCHFDICFA